MNLDEDIPRLLVKYSRNLKPFLQKLVPTQQEKILYGTNELFKNTELFGTQDIPGDGIIDNFASLDHIRCPFCSEPLGLLARNPYGQWRTYCCKSPVLNTLRGESTVYFTMLMDCPVQAEILKDIMSQWNNIQITRHDREHPMIALWPEQAEQSSTPTATPTTATPITTNNTTDEHTDERKPSSSSHEKESVSSSHTSKGSI